MNDESNTPVQIMFGISVLYWLGSRCLLYSALPASVPFARLLGANISYLLILGLGYWLGLNCSKKWLMGILEFVAILTATLLFPLVGYVMVAIMFFIKQANPAQN